MQQEIQQKIQNHHGLRRVLVKCDKNVVILEGTVGTFYLKQMAQTILLQNYNNLLIRNELVVRK